MAENKKEQNKEVDEAARGEGIAATEGNNLGTHRALLTQKTGFNAPEQSSMSVEDNFHEIELEKPTMQQKQQALEQLAQSPDRPKIAQIGKDISVNKSGSEQKEAQKGEASVSTSAAPVKGTSPGRGPPGRPGQGPKEKVRYMDLYKYSPRRDKIIVRLGLFCSIIAGATSPLYAIIVGKIVEMFDPLLDSQQKQEILHDFLWMIIVITAVIFLAGYAGFALMQISAERVSFKLRAHYLSSLMKQEISFFEKQQVESLPSKMAEYFVQISVGSGEKTGRIAAIIGATLSGAVISLIACPYLSLALLAYLPFCTILSKFLMGSFRTAAISKMRLNAQLGAFTEEMLSSLKLIVSFGNEGLKLKEYSVIANNAYVDAKKNAIRTGISSGLMFALMLGFTCFSWAVGFAFIKYEIDNPVYGRPTNVPDIVLSYQAQLFFMFSVMGILSNLPAIFQALIAGHEVVTLIDRKPLIVSNPDCSSKLNIGKGIVFEDVHFRYPTAQEHVPDVFQGLSFTIKVGTTTAIVGPSGSGKSTIVQMINRFYDPKSGSIKYGSNDLKDINLKNLRENIGYVGQEPVLIVGTIRENLQYGNCDATEEDMKQALKRANANFIFEMENGLDTYVGSSTVLNLSGGQKQRIAIARALINPKTPEEYLKFSWLKVCFRLNY